MLGLDVAKMIREEVARANREGRKFRGEYTLYKVEPTTVFQIPEEFCWLKTTKLGSQASVTAADRANAQFDLIVNNNKVNYDLALDAELIQGVEHPLEWPVLYYLPAGSKVQFSGATANSSTSYFLLHGFRPVKTSMRAITKSPFIYTLGFEDCAQNTAYSDTIEILADTTFYITHLIAMQRCRLEVAGTFTTYLVETNDVNVELFVMNRPINQKSASTYSIFGTGSFPMVVDAPIPVRGGTTLMANINTPAFGANERDIYLYFMGVQVRGSDQSAKS